MSKPDIRSQTQEQIQQQFQIWQEPAYRVSQVLQWLYARRAVHWDEMTNLPKALRQRLAETYGLSWPALARRQGARDTTQKFLWSLADGALIETVLIPANPNLYGEASDRHTLCVSTQVGCAYGCKFCASGLDGWKRNLGIEEIVNQVLAVERLESAQVGAPRGDPGVWTFSSLPGARPSSGAAALEYHKMTGLGGHAGKPDIAAPEDGRAPMPISATPSQAKMVQTPESAKRADPAQSSAGRLINNLVIMGMGEPLANYDNLLAALRILNAPWGGQMGARKITVSTSGLAPQIRRLADEPQQFRLAVSLHGATDETRARIMPINKKYPLKELAAACAYYQEKKGRMITLEYILIAGVNDALDHAAPLAKLALSLRAKVNLIPYNKVEGLPWERPAEPAQEAFLAALTRHKVTATLRREKGGEIDAACGQLRLKTEREMVAAG